MVLMIQGTASNVGKTILTLALCRIFKQDGYNVAPFKPQNITFNTHFCENGDEIAISQYLQALAAGVEPTADMNPVLLKPLPDNHGTQVIVNGKHFDKASLYNFKELKQQLIPKVSDAYSRLRQQYDIILIEGAGSPVELNLNKNDIVNMGMAKMANAPVILVSDIDRGGVFASLYGTVNLFTESEKAYVKATIINRFKGEAKYFADGVEIIEEITGLPVAGVVPYIDINLPEEDSICDSINPNSNFETSFNTIADAVRAALNMKLIYKILHGWV